jgi:hypothetical protein
VVEIDTLGTRLDILRCVKLAPRVDAPADTMLRLPFLVSLPAQNAG